MKANRSYGLFLAAFATDLWASSGALAAPNITNVVETGGDNEPTDTITAKFTGQTFFVSQANEPVPGAVVGTPYTVGSFGSHAPAFVDRNHRFINDPGTPFPAVLPVPAYLVGQEYIMSGNDNSDNASYLLNVTVANPSTAYILIDNRMSASTDAADNLDPPTFDATHMQWILNDGWVATANGLNRMATTTRPDELAMDEGADNTINQWYSVYSKQVPAGTFTLRQADNAGQNMYGVVVVPILSDYNHNGTVDAADYVVWRNDNGPPGNYTRWRYEFGMSIPPSSAIQAVPEPSSLLLCLAGIFATQWRRQRSAR